MTEREDQEANHISAGDDREYQPPSADQEPESENQEEPASVPQTVRARPLDESAWPTNGGPLGCLLGTIAGFVLGGFLGTTLLIFDRPIALALTVVFTVGLAIAGWQIGRSIFREYKPPKQRRRAKE